MGCNYSVVGSCAKANCIICRVYVHLCVTGGASLMQSSVKVIHIMSDFDIPLGNTTKSNFSVYIMYVNFVEHFLHGEIMQDQAGEAEVFVANPG